MKISVFKNFWLKITALALAILVWRVISGEITIVRTFDNIPLKVQLAKNMVITRGVPPKISITLSGPREVIDRISEEELTAYHDLRSQKVPAQISFHMTAQNISVPRRTKVIVISPENIDIDIDLIGERNLPVNVVFEGKPAPGYIVKEYTVDQNIVTVNGPEKKINKLKFIETKPVDLTGHNRTFLQEISLQPAFPGQSDLKKVQVLVKIEKEFTRQTFSQISIMILDNSEISRKAIVTPKIATVTLSGPKEVLHIIQPQEIKIYIDVSDLKPGKYTLPVSTLLPNGVIVENIVPKEIEVEIKSELEV